jgi:hypothetical protein
MDGLARTKNVHTSGQKPKVETCFDQPLAYRLPFADF